MEQASDWILQDGPEITEYGFQDFQYDSKNQICFKNLENSHNVIILFKLHSWVLHTWAICDSQLCSWWQMWWSPDFMWFERLSIRFWYNFNGLNSQNTDSLFKYIESTTTPLIIINSNVRSDLYVLSIRNGHSVPSRKSKSKAYNDNYYTEMRLLHCPFTPNKCLRTIMATEWQKKLRTLSLAKNMVRPPTAAGIGISFQNDVLPEILLDLNEDD